MLSLKILELHNLSHALKLSCMLQNSRRFKLLTHLYCLFFFSFQTTISFAQTVCEPVSLKCEYLVNPMGIDAAHPRLSWCLEDTRPGAKQTAYQVIVGTDSTNVSKGTGNYWQTGQLTNGT